MLILKNISKLLVLFFTIFVIQSTYAADVKIKRSCIKDNPLIQGVSDVQLLSIYTQICDKKNKDQRDQYLILAAKRFQQLGMNDRSLSIVNTLEAKQVKSQELTDVKFLIGTHLAGDALAKMRGQESRFLSKELTYPPAQILAENIRQSVPSINTESTKQLNSNHGNTPEYKALPSRAKNVKKKQRRSVARRKTIKNNNTSAIASNPSNSQKTTAPQNTTPFSGL